MTRRTPTALLTLTLLAALPLSAFGQPSHTSIIEQLEGDTPDAKATEKLFDDLIKDKSLAELQMLLAMLPKGGDLHHHYSGAIYAETYLEWVEQAGYSIDPKTLKVDRQNTSGSVSVEELRADADLYRKLLSTWSTKDFQGGQAGDAKFFQTFAYFGPLPSLDYSDGLRRLRDRAVAENVQYIETMLSAVRYYPTKTQYEDIASRIAAATTPSAREQALGAIADELAGTSKLKSAVRRYVRDLKQNHDGIDTDAFTLRYQTYAFRDTTPERVFASLVAAFAAAKDSDLIVGVNLVGPENGNFAIRDYTLHMEMFKVLRQRYPGVNVALHAGELKVGDVRPEDLRFHVGQAVELGGAKRLGHCVDLPLEDHRIQLMRRLKQDDIAVEINLTSNKFMLGVEGARHVFGLLHHNRVPMVISTDDAGVSRNTLSEEYLLLATRQHASYATIKQLVSNSIRYAFLPDATKVKLHRELQKRFTAFEKTMSDYAKDRADD